MKVLWLEPPNFSNALRKIAHDYLRNRDFNLYDFQFACLTEGCLIKETKTRWVADNNKYALFQKQIKKLAPDFIICNDKAALNYITGKYTSLAKCRGSIYRYENIPVLVIDDIHNTKRTTLGGWVLLQDLGKLKRWLGGQLREEPKFEYTVCHTFNEVQHLKFIAEIATTIAVDIETTGTTISSIQYTCLWKNNENIWCMHTWNVPFINPLKPNGCHWETENEEIIIWSIIRNINKTKAIKILQNGSYDSAYFLKYRIPLTNYIGDTLHAWHSVWVESPKRLDFIASIALDKYCYWKDEGKVEDDKEDKRGGKIPKTKAGMESYWLYGALDTHNTLLCFRFILAVMIEKKLDWAIENYRQEMRQQFGPALAMTMRGIKCNQKLQVKYAMELQAKSDQARIDLQTAMGDPNFNPNSPPQLQQAIYDIFQAKPYGRGKQRTSTDEKVLKMIKEQSFFLNWFVEKIWECKKPANNASKYGSGVTLGNRFMYKMCAGVTDTGRYASKAHDFWLGTNIQNMPYSMRPMLEADEGYILFDIDYSQSDAWFTAFESGDEKFMATMLDDKDTHCLHAEFFFKIAYDKIVAGHKANEDWVNHPTDGVRMNTKRIVHGSNYRMAGFTLYVTMGHEAVVASALKLGFADAHTWTQKQLVSLCDSLLASYLKLYPKLPSWFESSVREAVKNGNRATCAFGRTRIFFGNLANDAAIQRELSAYYGQGGTAGNINDTLIKCYWESDLESQGLLLIKQTHDSILNLVPEDKLWLCEKLLTIMEKECIVKERKFTVPVDASIGRSWGKKGMMGWREDISLAEIDAYEEKLELSYHAS